MIEHRKILRVCAKYRRRIKKAGYTAFMLMDEDLYDYAYLLMCQLEEIEELENAV